MRRSASVLFAALGLAGCASTQSVVLDCVPQEVSVYVDGRLLEPGVGEVVLRTDEPHKIYVKGRGYRPMLVVLQPTRDAEGRETLDADRVCLEPVLVGQGRELELRPEEPEPTRP